MPIRELSPKEESAQYEKLLLPWFKGKLQLEFIHAKVCPLKEPSIAKMLCPATGSLPLKDSWGVVMHQPFCKVQFWSELLIVAGG